MSDVFAFRCKLRNLVGTVLSREVLVRGGMYTYMGLVWLVRRGVDVISKSIFLSEIGVLVKYLIIAHRSYVYIK